MSKEDDDFLEYAAYHSISDFADISIAEIIILEFLAKYRKPVVRHTLFSEVKQFLEFKETLPSSKEENDLNTNQQKFLSHIKEQKQFSPSSFYGSLSTLEKRGILESNQSAKGKKTSIKTTNFTKYIPKLLLKFLINNDIMDSPESRTEFAKIFLKKIRNYDFKRVLSLWLSEYVVRSIFDLLTDFAEEVFILSKNEPDDDLKIKNSRVTEMIDNQISMPKDVFDGVIVPVYKKNPKFHEMSRDGILLEINRVTKPGGLIILIGVADLPSTNNVFINELIRLYKLALNNRIFSEAELKDDMVKAGLSYIDIFEHQGLLIGIGKK